MALEIGNQIGNVTKAVVAAKPAFSWWEYVLGFALAMLPFLVIGAVAGAWIVFSRSENQKRRVFLIRRTGDIDSFKFAKAMLYFDEGRNRYVFMPGRPKYLIKQWLTGIRQPLHLFLEGVSAEQDIKGLKTILSHEIKIEGTIYPGDDLQNSEYLQAYSDSELAQKVFKPNKDAGFMIVLAIAAFLGGSIAGAMILTMMNDQKAKAATAAAVKK